MTFPTAAEVESHAKAVGAVVAVLVAAWALATRWHRRRQVVQRRRQLESKAVRYTLDAVRHVLHVIQPGGEGEHLIDIDQLPRQLALVSDVREELWIADGHTSRREAERLEGEIVKVLTRTQAIQRRNEAGVGLFKDGWTGGRNR